MAPQIDVLFIHCREGLGRSAAAAMAVAMAYDLPWECWTKDPYSPNPHVLKVIAAVFGRELPVDSWQTVLPIGWDPKGPLLPGD